MSLDLVIDGGFKPRHYQIPYMAAMDGGCKFAVWVMHRRGGKDRTALAQTVKMAFKRIGLYWHCLPNLRQGRKVIWDNITSEGKNLIRQTFPDEIVARKIDDEMKIELVNGSIVQIVGADNFDALVGASPVHVTFSEWSLTDPRAYDFVRPILRENNGSVAFIFTPRGYNHGWKTLQVAK
jgi:phage terminase large subunit